MQSEIDKQTMAKAYARWAPVYDLVFGAVFERGRMASIEAAERIGGRILDVGVGTGISLKDYSRSNRLVGVDYSEPMLRKAQERVIEHKLTNVETLAVMDAKHLGVSGRVVRRGGGAIRHHRGAGARGHARRICPRAQAGRRDRAGQPHRRGNRFAPRVRAMVLAGGAAARLAAGISLGAACELGRASDGVQLIERRPMPPLGHFSLIRFGKDAAPVQIAARASG